MHLLVRFKILLPTLTKNNSSFTFTLSELLQIEEAMNGIHFDGIPLGGATADFFYSTCYFSGLKINITGHVMNIARYFLHKIRKEIRPDAVKTEYDRKYVFNYSANSERLTDLFKPLLPYFTKEEVVFASKPDEHNPDWNEYPFLSYDGLTRLQYKNWEQLFTTLEKDIERFWLTLTIKKKIPEQVRLQFLLFLTIQTKRLIYFKDLFYQNKPSAILCDHDRQALNAAIVMSAKYHRIPTYTLVHGSTLPPDHFYPLLADKVFCWGEMQKQQFISLGVKEEQIVVAGNLKFKKTHQQFLAKSQTTQTHKVLLIFSNPIEHHQKIRFIEDILQHTDDSYKVILRIHPAECKEDYHEQINKYKKLLAVDQTDQTIDESLNISDIVISHNSTAAIEALLKDIPVAIYAPDYITFPPGIATLLNEEARIPLVTDIRLLPMTITQFSDEKYVTDYWPNVRQFLSNYCQYYGDESAFKIASYIKDHVYTTEK